jgi:hypothetical protein
MQYDNKAPVSSASLNGNGSLDPILTSHRSAESMVFSVAADNNGAAVLLKPRKNHRAVRINWGDGNSDYLDFHQKRVELDPTLPTGSYLIRHAYFKNPMTGQSPGRVHIILAVFNEDGGKSFEGAILDIDGAKKWGGMG